MIFRAYLNQLRLRKKEIRFRWLWLDRNPTQGTIDKLNCIDSWEYNYSETQWLPNSPIVAVLKTSQVEKVLKDIVVSSASTLNLLAAYL